MTDTETDWIADRSNCNIEEAFEEIFKAVKSDIERFNELPPEKREHRRAELNRVSLDAFHVAIRNADGETLTNTVSVKKDRFTAYVTTSQDNGFSVTPEWQYDEKTCELRSKNGSLTTKDVSYRALVHLLFPPRLK